MNERAIIGDNNPPVDLYDEAKNTINDLYEEAKRWLDGGEVKTSQELDGVSMLLDGLQKAAKLADNNRKTEKKPFDDGGKAVQAKYKPILERVQTAQDFCKKAMQPYLQEQERLKQEQERIARQEAEKAEREALQAANDIQSLEGAERAQEAIDKAQDAQKTADDIAKQKVQAKGGERAIGLRTVWETKILNAKLALRWAWSQYPNELEELALNLAKKEVRSGERKISGFEITETKVL